MFYVRSLMLTYWAAKGAAECFVKTFLLLFSDVVQMNLCGLLWEGGGISFPI